MKLRPYQEKILNDTLDYINNPANKGVGGLVVAPMASGKSLMIGSIANAVEGGVLVIQPSVELLHQNLEKYEFYGSKASIYSAKAGVKEIGKVTFATIGSIYKKANEFKKMGVETVLIDEAQYAPTVSNSMYKQFLKVLRPKNIIGFTATPCRLYAMGTREDNYSVLNLITNRIKNEHPIFKKMVSVLQVQEIYKEFWSPINYELYDFDTKTLRLNSTGSEYTEESIKKAIAEQGINNHIYNRVMDLNKQGITKILVFNDCLETANKMASLIPNSAVLSSHTTPEERTRIVEEFKQGKIWNVFNYTILQAGFDYPELQAVIIGRPTNSYVFYMQSCGRGVRIHPNKKDVRIIDYCNNVKKFGKLEELTVEYVKNHGWGMFSNNKLLTGVRMGTMTVTKDDLLGNVHGKQEPDDIKFWFGKHNGKKPSEVPLNYLRWVNGEMKIKGSSSEKMIRLITQVKWVLKKEGLL